MERSDSLMMNDARLAETVRRLVQALQPERIVLLGSRARGEVDEESDLDLLVLQRTDARRIEREWAAEEALGWDRPLATDVMVLTPEEYDRGLARGDPILREIEEEGVSVYERAG